MEIAHAQGFVVGSAKLVADVLLSVFDAAEEPAHTSAKRLDQIPQVHGIPQRTKTEEATPVWQSRLLQTNGSL